MLKASICVAFLLSSIISFSSGYKTSYDYYIVFVGRFQNEKISLTINNKPLINNYQLENTDPTKKGNLSITQTEDHISIFYNGQEIKRSKVSVDFNLNLAISVNNKNKSFRINLRKGKVILVDYEARPENALKTLSIEQVQEPILLI